ncbi:2,3-bisphosphoglycerate-dependent phosphoglycerate mutase [Paucidesulfovibrio gracilis DSM 16080]|uniref:2,3-bisphosphoglycerate-dependent phosphoglycerate mutase n=1 Tax=Paucidesulfovibrio gracilis DSM 16080 TaxID=1121449 RepID=A0A1T4WRE3_9BACT|nr:2,3-diphosphoglycerate-dependent phosphoglycerate mutase [Paucidesulfovibrio gracilis]SKA79923.1 2,3-bisphosphoglycerate-dependent phosphoglycerate mutase [Paucidesulfovibrio gracilis DSM 16080]
MHRLVLIRHGQSVWNLENRFTGWTDVDLSDQGREEAREGASQLLAEGLDFDVCHTSLLKRAIRTLWIVRDVMDRLWLPVRKTWRLNERHYGALQGLNKAETAAEYGEEQVFAWRRGYAVAPPPLEPSDSRWPGLDLRYDDLPRADLPVGESLEQTIERTMPYWHDVIVPDLQAGRRVLVVAHGNSLRGLVKHLDGLDEQAIMDVNIPTGIPLLYELDQDMRPLAKKYLGNSEAVAKAQAEVAGQGRAG